MKKRIMSLLLVLVMFFSVLPIMPVRKSAAEETEETETLFDRYIPVNKAYSVLKQEGFLRVERRRGAVIALDTDKMRTISEMRRDLSVILARGVCKNVSREEVHDLVDSIYDAFTAE